MGQPKNRFSSYQYSEGRTGTEQLVEFTCPLGEGEAEKVRAFLQTNIRSLDLPTTGQVSIAHGGYGRYTRYDVTQHDYAGGGPGEGGGWGYIEVLEIKNPPDGRRGIVINECQSHSGSTFTEWETIENARAAFAKSWSLRDAAEKFPTLPGFKRRVVCGALTPWFYAIGDEHLIGDYAFPEGLQDDPVYRFGRQFVIFDDKDVPTIKACMGTRFISYFDDSYPRKEHHYRLVYFDDGSVWDENFNPHNPPRLIEEGEAWIAEAVQQFKQLLTGKTTEFTVNFTDGNKFIGRLMQTNRRGPCAEGDYFLVVRLKGEKKSRHGWVHFKPTPEVPDVIQYATQQFAQKGQEIEKIEVKECKTETRGKKWSGAFFHPPR